MGAFTQNKIGTITLTDELIKEAVTSFANNNKNYKLTNLTIQQNETNRFSFSLFYTSKIKTTLVADIDSLVGYVSRMIESNLQIFGSVILVKTGN
ncbi:MAG: hypothetical protein LBT17_01335 [Mycoplasmataceae bacterium]|jgi:hypothetical protein|nr:hypothetical protein [Mycoplasmataceae bacterium]